jgi:catechol 2,3-dioxygenase-like lactoylglutathione lyase family enzyme
MDNDRPVLNMVNVVTLKMAPVVDFYRLLGVEIPDTPAPWDQHHREAETPDGIGFDLDSASFASQWNQGWPEDRTGAVIGFRVEERATVDAVFSRLVAAGHVGQQPPYDTFWGARYAVVQDPAGNSVGIMSRVDPERRAQPPDPSGGTASGG